MAAPITERTVFMVQANSTAPGRFRRSRSSFPPGGASTSVPLRAAPSRDMALALPVQRANQGEEPPRGIKVNRDLAGEALLQDAASLVVQAPPPHVDRL